MNFFSRMVFWVLTGFFLTLQIASAQNHQITFWRHNYQGAVTISFDDGLPSQVTSAIPLLNARGLKATFFVVTGSIPVAPNGWDVTWDQWRQVAAQGHEIGSHTVNHVDLTALSDSDLRNELSESQLAIKQNIPSQSCVSLAYPMNLNNAHVQSITSEYYISARGGWAEDGGGEMNFYDDPDPNWPLPPDLALGNYKAVNFYDVAGDNSPFAKPLSNLDDKLDFAIAHHAWYDMYLHDIPDGSYYTDYFATLLDHIIAKKLWMASYGEVAQYMRERKASTLSVLSSDSSAIQLSLTNSLDGLVYREALTVRSIVPSAWLKVTVTQGSTSTVVSSTVEGANTVLYFDALPNGGTIVLTQAEALPDFSLTATPAGLMVTQGASGDFSISVTPSNGFTDSVTFSVTGLPSGTSAAFTPNPATGSSTLNVATSSVTPAGTYPLAITGTSGSLSHTAAISITVNVPDFSLSATPPTQTVMQGVSGSYDVTVNPANGFTGTVSFSVSGLPTGASGTFTPNPTTGSSALTVATTPSTPGGTYPLIITGVSGSLTHTLSVSIIVNAPDFSLSATPSSRSVVQGGSGNYGVTITPLNSFSNPVTFSVSGLPTEATGAFTPNPATGSSTLTVATTASTPRGTYSLLITGVSGSLTYTTSVSLTVTVPDFSLSATPPTQTILLGSGGNYGVTVTPISGFTNAVTLSVSGLPTGATGSFSPNPATGSSTLTVTSTASTPVGTYPLTITGVSGALTHTATVSVTISTTLPPPGVFLDAVGPSSGGTSVASASSLTWNHTITSTGSNLLLIAAVSVGASPDTNRTLAVTYDGVAMTPVGLVHSNNSTLGYTQMFSLKAPATGTHAVVATLTGGNASLAGGSASFTGVDQVNPIRNIATKFGTGVSPNVTVTSSQGDMVVDAMVTGCDGTITSSKTLLWLKQVNCSTAGGIGAQSMAAGAPSVTMGYTVPSDWWGMIGVDVVGAPAPPATDFNLSTEGDKSVTQGSAVTNAVTASLLSGIAQNVTFSASGLPTGVTASFNPGNCTPTCATTLTLTASASATVGAFPITLTGTAGSVSRTTSFTLNVTAPIVPDFSLSATPPSQTVTQGASGDYSVTITPTNGFSNAVTLSVAGLPTGATGTFAPNPATGSSSTLTVATISTTPAGTYALTITGVSGSLSHTTTVSITVNAPDFSLSATPPSQTVTQGASGDYNVTITPANGFSSPVTFSISGLPAGATGTFTPNPATGSATLTVATTAGTTPGGTFPLTITGVSGSLSHTAAISITVTVPDFSLSATPPNQTVAQGASANYNVPITPTNGFAGAVTFSVSGLPAGATGTFTPNPATGSSTLTVATTASTPAGTYPLTITGVSGALTHTSAISITVNVPDFSLGATPASQTVVQGASGNYSVTITPINGFAGTVALSVSGLPAGATGTFTPNPAIGSATLAVATTASTPVGTYPITITGISGSLSHTATVSLSVTTNLPPPVVVAFDAVGPSSVGAGAASVAAGGTLTWNHTVTTSGSNLLLVVAVSVGSSPDTGRTLAVTYNGVAMTPVGLVHSNNKTLGYTQMFALKAPATGTHAVVVTLTGGKASLAGGSVSFTGVDQTTPIRNIATAFGTGVSPKVTVTSAPGDMVVDAMITGCDGTITSGKTLRWLKQVNCSTAGGIGAQSTTAGAASVTMGYTVPSDWWGMIGADIVAAH